MKKNIVKTIQQFYHVSIRLEEKVIYFNRIEEKGNCNHGCSKLNATRKKNVGNCPLLCLELKIEDKF